MAYALDMGFNIMTFMHDPHGGKERLIRVELPEVSPDQPMYLQMGSTPQAKLYKSEIVSRFGQAIIQIMNYLRQQCHDFIYHKLHHKFGTVYANAWTPKLRPVDMLVHAIMTKNAGYGAHHDGKSMLCDDTKEGYTRRDM